MTQPANSSQMHRVTVGEVDGDSAVISMGTEPPHVFRLPLALLPPGTAAGRSPPLQTYAPISYVLCRWLWPRAVVAGNIILLQTMRDSGAVQERERGIRALQAEIRARFRRWVMWATQRKRNVYSPRAERPI